MAAELGWEEIYTSWVFGGAEGVWRGRRVQLVRLMRNGARERVRLTISTKPPGMLRIHRRGAFDFLDFGGPPAVEVPSAEELQIRSDPAGLAATLVDGELMALIRQTLVTRYDEIDLQPNRLHIECNLTSFEGTSIDATLRRMWRLGTAIVERLERKV